MNPASLETYIQTALGIAVSIVTFLIGYRQTIGARKERTRAANASLHRAILRRMVLEDYCPTTADLERLAEGKAREFQVRQSDLASPSQVLNALFTDVFDSDLIPPAQRVELEGKLRDALSRSASRDAELSPPGPGEEATRENMRSRANLVSLTVATALLGTVASLLPQIVQGRLLDLQFLTGALGVFVVSLVAISGIITVRRNREAPEEQSAVDGASRMAEFELRVARELDRIGLPYKAGVRAGVLEVDFIVEMSSGPVVVEVKGWRGPVPLSVIRRTIEMVGRMKQEFRSTDAFIVVPETKHLPRAMLATPGVHFVQLKELAAALKRSAA